MKLRKSWALPLVAMLVTFALLVLVGFGGDRVVVVSESKRQAPDYQKIIDQVVFGVAGIVQSIRKG